MSAVLADTVTIVRWLADDPRLSETAVNLLQAADDGYGIHISAITLVDIWYATHKRHHPIEFDELNSLDDVVAAPEINIHVLPSPARSLNSPENRAGRSCQIRSTG